MSLLNRTKRSPFARWRQSSKVRRDTFSNANQISYAAKAYKAK